MKENLLKKHSDCMRNTHFRALISPYKKNHYISRNLPETFSKGTGRDISGSTSLGPLTVMPQNTDAVCQQHRPT